MIEKSAISHWAGSCGGLLDLNHTGFINLNLASALQIAKFVATSRHTETNFAIRALAPGENGLQAGKIRIGTRGSPLALAQARQVAARLAAAHGLPAEQCELVIIKTTGDRVTDRPLIEAGGKGLFTKELEEALFSGAIDLAVHSMKDMPAQIPAGLGIAAILPREDPRDAFVSVKYASFEKLPSGAVIGTSSPRRQAQALRLRPDLRVVPFRGNVETRLRKLAEGVADATFLACAGLNRLGLAQHVTNVMSTEAMLPAVAQGAIGIEIRLNDAAAARLLAPLNDAPTAQCVAAERAYLAQLEGSCRTPIAGHAELHGGKLRLRGQILATDGTRAYEGERTGNPEVAVALGEQVAAEVLERAGPDFFAAV
ncbi:MAG: hydroxymethylbilane synthase [Hyphomicrobium sp.]|nr:MAG: hydroxymethylbilane synthase [Hyphomicrobium sp.]